jgi:hypothetical protein
VVVVVVVVCEEDREQDSRKWRGWSCRASAGGAGKRKAAGGEGGRGYGAAAWSAPYTLDAQLTDNNTLHVRGRLVYTRWICPRGIAVYMHSSDDSERFSVIAA